MATGSIVEKSLREVLEEVSERLYAGFYIYAAIAYAVWIPILSIFMLLEASVSTLLGAYSWVVPVAYWAVAGYSIGYAMEKYWKGYYRRLETRLGIEAGERNRCRKASLVAWLLTPFTILLFAGALSLVYGGSPNVFAVSLMLGLSPGLFSNVAIEYCTGEKKPASLIAAIGVVVLSPLGFQLGWGGAAFSIIASYSLTVLAYLVKALTKLA